MKGNSDYLDGNYTIAFDEALYAPGTPCITILPDSVHENFRGPIGPSVSYTPYIHLNDWHAVVFTYDGTNAKLFVDCQLKYSIPLSSYQFVNSDDLFFGRLNDNVYPYWYNGDLDEVRIYSIIYQLIGKVDSKNNSGNQQYSFTDNNIVLGMPYFYRLKMQEKSGEIKYSFIRTCKILTENYSASLIPNPSGGITELYLNNWKGATTVQLINMKGQLLYQQHYYVQKENSSVHLDFTQQPKGCYQLIIQNGKMLMEKKLILL